MAELSKTPVPVRECTLDVLAWGPLGPATERRTMVLGAFWCFGCRQPHVFNAGMHQVTGETSPSVAGTLYNDGCSCTIEHGEVTYSAECVHKYASHTLVLLPEDCWPMVSGELLRA